ncbi:MAG TPA: LTA synthase family protein [Mobilitalea sp.]|nr:LTA synthase family protein [Mobilitalea sp.]
MGPENDQKDNSGLEGEKETEKISVEDQQVVANDITESQIVTGEDIENEAVASEATESQAISGEDIEDEAVASEATESQALYGKDIENDVAASEVTASQIVSGEDIVSDAVASDAVVSDSTESQIVTGNATEGKNMVQRRVRRSLKIIAPVIFFVSVIIYLELVFHLMVYKSIDLKILYPILFAIPVGLLISLFSGFFSRRINQLIMWFFTGLSCLVFGLQLVYFYVFKMFFSFQSLGMAGDAVNEFTSDVFEAISANLFGLFLILLPLPVLGFLIHKVFACERRLIRQQGMLLAGTIGLHILALIALLFFGKEDYSPYDLYHHTKVPELCGKQLGVVVLTRFDLAKLIKGEDELVLADISAISLNVLEKPVATPTAQPIPTTAPQLIGNPASGSSIVLVPGSSPTPSLLPTPIPLPTPTPVDTSPNILDIDFASLAKVEKDETIETLHNYFASVTPTNKNEYTGMFEGYNLIMITAEGFSPYAVHKEATPTLYKLTHEGFIFNNFYTALWQTSTSDGEYAAMTGLIPVGTRSMFNSRDNLMPFALGHQFNLLGIESKAYHNHTYTYYQRNETHPNLGYIFTGKGNGLILDSDVWPGSDLEMINHTVDEFTGEDQFHIYYLTVSGHMNYTFTGNSMASKNKELVKDLPYSSDCRAYIACQIELDRALEQLILKLEEAGVADRTVIALSADHYPYGWEKEKLDELAGHVVEPNFEIYRNHFILWNPAMEESIIIDKPSSSLDILPTLSNLFGIQYDSRLLMGQDILSEAEPLVILNNRSFITDKIMYNSETGEMIYLDEGELPENYVTNINKIIQNKFNVSKSIVKKDYYRYLFPHYPEGFE